MNKNFENNFNYHAPKEGQPEMYGHVRNALKEAAYMIDGLCPDSREKSLAMTKLEEAMFWANASIARTGYVVPIEEDMVYVENEDVLKYVHEQTGFEKDAIQAIFDAESDYLKTLGIVEDTE